MARNVYQPHRCSKRGVLLMSNHQNEEILERLYDEEWTRVRERWPKLDEDQVGMYAAYFARKRFEEENQ
jgi:hypothetical protein